MILVTGCAGYIGSHICYILKKKRINFIGVDNLKYSNKENIISKKISTNVTFLAKRLMN